MDSLPQAGQAGQSSASFPIADHVLAEPVACGRRLAELLAGPEHSRHHQCGVDRRPCSDCRRCAPLACADPDRCGGATGPVPTGADRLCRPCAATWRCRFWRTHPRYIRAYHQACERYPALATLHSDQRTAAALYLSIRLAVRRDVRQMLARELPEAIRCLSPAKEVR